RASTDSRRAGRPDRGARSSRRPEPLGVDRARRVAELDEDVRDPLHEAGRAADEDVRALGRPRADLLEHRAVDAAIEAVPALRALACERAVDGQAGPVRQLPAVEE